MCSNGSSIILVVDEGDEGQGKQSEQVLHDLARCWGEQNQLLQREMNEFESRVFQAVFPCRVKTKYYHAEVEFCRLKKQVYHELTLKDVDEILVDVVGHRIQAVVGFLHKYSENALDIFQSSFKKIVAMEEVETSLCVGMCFKTETVENRNTIQKWCAENMVEFVEAHEVLQESASPFDKCGIKRIAEAMDCTMWASMIPLAVPSQSLVVSSEKDHSLNETAEETASEANKFDTSRVTSDDDEVSKTKNNEIMSSNKESRVFQDNFFNQMLEQIQEIRGSAATLSDEERRRTAAEMAMKLMSIIGDDDSEEEECNHIL